MQSSAWALSACNSAMLVCLRCRGCSALSCITADRACLKLRTTLSQRLLCAKLTTLLQPRYTKLAPDSVCMPVFADASRAQAQLAVHLCLPTLCDCLLYTQCYILLVPGDDTLGDGWPMMCAALRPRYHPLLQCIELLCEIPFAVLQCSILPAHALTMKTFKRGGNDLIHATKC